MIRTYDNTCDLCYYDIENGIVYFFKDYQFCSNDCLEEWVNSEDENDY